RQSDRGRSRAGPHRRRGRTLGVQRLDCGPRRRRDALTLCTAPAAVRESVLKSQRTRSRITRNDDPEEATQPAAWTVGADTGTGAAGVEAGGAERPGVGSCPGSPPVGAVGGTPSARVAGDAAEGPVAGVRAPVARAWTGATGAGAEESAAGRSAPPLRA